MMNYSCVHIMKYLRMQGTKVYQVQGLHLMVQQSAGIPEGCLPHHLIQPNPVVVFSFGLRLQSFVARRSRDIKTNISEFVSIAICPSKLLHLRPRYLKTKFQIVFVPLFLRKQSKVQCITLKYKSQCKSFQEYFQKLCI